VNLARDFYRSLEGKEEGWSTVIVWVFPLRRRKEKGKRKPGDAGELSVSYEGKKR